MLMMLPFTSTNSEQQEQALKRSAVSFVFHLSETVPVTCLFQPLCWNILLFLSHVAFSVAADSLRPSRQYWAVGWDLSFLHCQFSTDLISNKVYLNDI